MSFYTKHTSTFDNLNSNGLSFYDSELFLYATGPIWAWLVESDLTTLHDLALQLFFTQHCFFRDRGPIEQTLAHLLDLLAIVVFKSSFEASA